MRYTRHTVMSVLVVSLLMVYRQREWAAKCTLSEKYKSERNRIKRERKNSLRVHLKVHAPEGTIVWGLSL